MKHFAIKRPLPPGFRGGFPQIVAALGHPGGAVDPGRHDVARL
ncbi:MAG TPA: hypothetical protein VF502_04975 [Stellaceae bacterium]